MNGLDFLLIGLILVGILKGIQSGFVQQAFSTIGLVSGLLFGAWVQVYLIDMVENPESKALLSLCIILAGMLIGMTLGEYAGLRVKDGLTTFKIIANVDRSLGAVFGCVAILLGVWLAAAVFANAPGALQQHIRSSRIITGLNQVLPDAPAVITKLAQFINPNAFPQVFAGMEPRFETDAPLPTMDELTSAIQNSRNSIVKITGEGCGGIVEGSGFVASDGWVITNAHVVAGVARPKVIDANGQHDAVVMEFNSKLDIAALRANNLAGQPLALHTSLVNEGAKGVVMGYPGGGNLTASPAAVLEQFTAKGRDIYNQSTTERSVYSVKADVRQGDSGGPLIAADGSVIGVIFAESTAHPDVGYALTADQVANELKLVQTDNTPAATGMCAQ